MSKEIARKLDSLAKQIEAMKEALDQLSCNCRGRGKRIWTTSYHNPEELRRILSVRCPLHGLRDPGFVMYASIWCPINKEDWEHCKCPPLVHRDAIMGRIPLPSDPQERLRRISELKEEEARKEQGQPPMKRNYKEEGREVRNMLLEYGASTNRETS